MKILMECLSLTGVMTPVSVPSPFIGFLVRITWDNLSKGLSIRPGTEWTVWIRCPSLESTVKPNQTYFKNKENVLAYSLKGPGIGYAPVKVWTAGSWCHQWRYFPMIISALLSYLGQILPQNGFIHGGKTAPALLGLTSTHQMLNPAAHNGVSFSRTNGKWMLWF